MPPLASGESAAAAARAMFRALRPRIQPISRTVERVAQTRRFTQTTRCAQTPGPQTLVVHHVKFRKPKLRRRFLRGFTTFLAFYLAYCWYDVYIWSPFANKFTEQLEAQENDGELDDDEEELEKGEDDDRESWSISVPGSDQFLFWIPLPFAYSIVPQPPFKRGCPELQRYAEASKDPELGKRLGVKLAQVVCSTCQGSSSLTKRFGNVRGFRGATLVTKFPTHPPPVFVQKGLTISGVQTRVIDYPKYHRTRRALEPVETTKAAYAYLSVLFLSGVSDVRDALGFPAKGKESSPGVMPTPPGQVTIQGRPNQNAEGGKDARALATGKGTQTPPPAKDSGSEAAGANVNRQQQNPPDPNKPRPTPTQGVTKGAPSSTEPPPKHGPNPSESGIEGIRSIFGIDRLREHFAKRNSAGQAAFRRQLGPRWYAPRCPPPRGAWEMSGVLVVLMDGGLVMVDVRAWWDPLKEKFDSDSMLLQVRDVVPTNQS